MAKDALSYAYKLIGMKDYFSGELYEKVSKKYNAEDAADVISRFSGLGYLNDERVAKSYISYKLRSGYGPYYIGNKLYAKGVTVTADEIMKIAADEDIDMESQIKRLADRYEIDKADDRYKQYAKCMTFLQNRGYPFGLCDKVIKKRGDY